ncbi:PLP-dependent aminotransferase family protein [bacterium]|nr:PLP-dependent aminotransferase family protein [bacterium]
MDFEKYLAPRTNNMKASIIRELLKLTARPGMISLGGGMPAPESFPLDIIMALTQSVLDKYGPNAFQYGPTEGFPPLREALVPYLYRNGMEVKPERIMVTTGSQGFLDALGKAFIAKGDIIAVEAPTYLGAIQAFNAYEPEYVTMETDDQGLIPDSLEKILKEHKVKFVYLIPTFQNPSGRTIPLSRRKEIVALAKKYEVLLVEDDPYSALRYQGDAVPTFQSLAPEYVVYTSTFSKIFAPGFRLGFSVAPDSVQKWLVVAKQGIDLHTSTFNQALAAEYLTGGHMDRQLPKILKLYRPRQKAMLAALETFFPSSFKWSRPEGGMFIWAEGPEELDSEKLFYQAVEKNVAFVPGKYFYPKPGLGNATMRLNFTNVNEESIFKGIQILGNVLKENAPE